MQGISDTANTPNSGNLFKISVKELIALGAQLKSGDIEAVATSVSLPENPQEGSVLFLSPKFSVGKIDQIQILITPENYEQDISSQLSPKAAWVTTKDFRGLMGKVLAHFDKKSMSFPESVSDKSSVSHKAHIGAGVRIAPFAVIQEDVVLGENVWIGAGAVIQRGAKIGKNSIIHSNVVIGHHCEVGESSEIQYNTSVGSEGFGYVPRNKQTAEKIPQIGRVILGDHVDIGANVAIDRGAIGDTVIGSGTKIDNLSHIAHNCKIGRNCLLAASFKIAGSSEIGDFVTAAGDVVVADHVKITSHVVLGGRSAVTKDIETPGAYAGYPLLPIKDSMRAVASIRELPRLRKEVADLKRQLAEILTQLGK